MGREEASFRGFITFSKNVSRNAKSPFFNGKLEYALATADVLVLFSSGGWVWFGMIARRLGLFVTPCFLPPAARISRAMCHEDH